MFHLPVQSPPPSPPPLSSPDRPQTQLSDAVPFKRRYSRQQTLEVCPVSAGSGEDDSGVDVL